MPVAPYLIVVIVSYLLGSIPTGFLLARARGLDIRTIGSGNIGATNVFRSLGVPAGVFVLLADAAKGWLSVFIAIQWVGPAFRIAPHSTAGEWLALCAGVFAILGHNFTCWLRFKGGKGVATSAGVLIALMPNALLIIFCVWVLVFALTRYVSLASICAAAALPPAAWVTHASLTMMLITGALAVLAIFKHRTNIQRLLNGTENRVGRKRAPAPSGQVTP